MHVILMAALTRRTLHKQDEPVHVAAVPQGDEVTLQSWLLKEPGQNPDPLIPTRTASSCSSGLTPERADREQAARGSPASGAS